MPINRTNGDSGQDRFLSVLSEVREGGQDRFSSVLADVRGRSGGLGKAFAYGGLNTVAGALEGSAVQGAQPATMAPSLGGFLKGAVTRSVGKRLESVGVDNPLAGAGEQMAMRAIEDTDAREPIRQGIIQQGMEAGEAVRRVAEGLGYERSEGVKGLLEDAAGAIPQLAGGIASGVAGTAAGGPLTGMAAAAGFFAITDAGSQTSDVYKRLLAEGMDEKEAATRAADAGKMYGLASGALEFIGVGSVVGKPLKKHMLRAAESRAGKLAAAGGRAAGAGAAEGLTEAAQGVLGEAVTAWARKDWEEFRSTWNDLDTRGREFAVGALLGTAVRGGVEALDPSNYRSAEEMLEAIETEPAEESRNPTEVANQSQPDTPQQPSQIGELATEQAGAEPAQASSSTVASPQSTPVRIVLKDAPVAPQPDSRLGDGTPMFKDRGQAEAYIQFKKERTIPGDKPLRVVEPLQGAAEPMFAVLEDDRLAYAQARGEAQSAEVTEFAREAGREAQRTPSRTEAGSPAMQAVEPETTRSGEQVQAQAGTPTSEVLPPEPTSVPRRSESVAGPRSEAAQTESPPRQEPSVPPVQKDTREPWEMARERTAPYAEGLRTLSDKELENEVKRASDALGEWSRQTPSMIEIDGEMYLNPDIRTSESFELSERFRAASDEKDFRESGAHLTQQQHFDRWVVRNVPKGDRERFLSDAESVARVRGQLDNSHRQAVNRALRDGHPVPPEVLAEYPDLAANAPKVSDDTVSGTHVEYPDRYKGLGKNATRRRAQIDTLINDGRLSQSARDGEWTLRTPTESGREDIITGRTAREVVKIAEDRGQKIKTASERAAESEQNKRIVKRAYDDAGVTPPETSIAHEVGTPASEISGIIQQSKAKRTIPVQEMTRPQLLAEAERLGVSEGPKSKPALRKRVEGAAVAPKKPTLPRRPHVLGSDAVLGDLNAIAGRTGDPAEWLTRLERADQNIKKGNYTADIEGDNIVIRTGDATYTIKADQFNIDTESIGGAVEFDFDDIRDLQRRRREVNKLTIDQIREHLGVPAGRNQNKPGLVTAVLRRERGLPEQSNQKTERRKVVTKRLLDLADRLESSAREANAKMNVPRGRSSGATLPPAYYANLVKIGSAKVLRGVAKFSDFAAQMIESEGDWIEPSLRDIYRDSLELAGDMETTETVPTTEEVTRRVNARREREANATSARVADIEADRADLGLDALDSPARRSWQEAHNTAKAQGIPGRAMQYAAEVNAKPRALSDIETAGLVQRAAELKKHHRQVMAQMADADPAQTATLAAEAARIESEFDALSEALRKSGTEKGRALASQRLALDQDFSLIAVKARAKAAKGESLTEKQEALITNLVRRLEDADARAAKAEARLKEAKAQQAVKTHKKNTKRPPKIRAVEFDAKLARARELLAKGCR